LKVYLLSIKIKKNQIKNVDKLAIETQLAIGDQFNQLVAQAAQAGGAIKLSKRKLKHLPRSVTVLDNDQVFLHTKVILGQGAEKTVKLNIEIFSGAHGARASDHVSARNWVRLFSKN